MGVSEGGSSAIAVWSTHSRWAMGAESLDRAARAAPAAGTLGRALGARRLLLKNVVGQRVEPQPGGIG